MENLSRRFADFMTKNNIITEQDKEIYRFGFVLMLRIILNVSTLLFIGACFDMIVETIVFVIYSLMIRSYSGGFHSDNPIICYLISVVTTVLMLFCIKFGVLNIRLNFMLIALSIGVILIYAPVEHKNKPLEEVERKIYKRNLIKILIGLIFVVFMFLLFDKISMMFASGYAFLVSAIMILICVGEKK